MTDGIEITTFQLADGQTLESFIAANADVDAWLVRQPGFVSRRIAQRPDGVVVDLLIWGSEQAGVDGAQRLMAELPDSPVHAAIDQDTVSWSVITTSHRVEAAAIPPA
jgi:hypothetical protein